MSANGTINRLVKDKGFGFIMGGDSKEYFLHHSDLKGYTMFDLAEGDRVTFEGGDTPKGPRASAVFKS